jgi:hypothetical protein
VAQPLERPGDNFKKPLAGTISKHCASAFLGIETANNDLRCSFVAHRKAFKQSWSSLVALRNVESSVVRSSGLRLNGARATSTGGGRMTGDFTPSPLSLFFTVCRCLAVRLALSGSAYLGQ